MSKIAIFGGTFNPVHNEHVTMVTNAILELGLDKVIVVPTFLPPHKNTIPAPASDRLNMLKLAFSEVQKVEISDFEVNKQGKSYSYQTVEHFKEKYPNDQIYFVCGGDMLTDFKTWKNPDRILKSAKLVVFDREDFFTDYQKELQYFKEIFNDSFQIGQRRLTVSTSGIIPGINRLAELDMQSTLALSLHAPNHEIRKSLMQIENKYNMRDLKIALKNNVEKTGRRITIEYLLIKDLNDTTDSAKQLAEYLHDIKCNVNLIPYNPTAQNDYKRPSNNAIMKFKCLLEHSGKKVTVRLERGADIDAACGQLKGKVE